MPRAIQIKKQGAAGVMKWAEVPVGKPKRGQILINQSHVGLNYIDVYHRSGLYPLEMPHGIGMEAAGTVEAVGAGVNGSGSAIVSLMPRALPVPTRSPASCRPTAL